MEHKRMNILKGGFIWLFLFVFLTTACKNSESTPIPSNSDQPDTTIDQHPVADGETVDLWLTTADKSVLFEKQNKKLQFSSKSRSNYTVEVDTTATYQTIDGFGFSLTDASAYLIYGLPDAIRKDLLENLFSAKGNGIGISYLRITIGASDLSLEAYSYDDMPNGQTDVNLEHFSMERDKTVNHLIPLLKEILEINPNIKIMGSPWSAPAWMKDNNSTIGGSLEKKYYDVYARYFVKYINKMKGFGIPIDAITPQNEPMNPNNNPSMYMTWQEERDFIKYNLGPAFENAEIDTKIIIWDHNADRPAYPINILNDPDARKYIDGSAFHLYNGSITALSTVHDAYPQKNIYFTEQYTPKNGSFPGDLKWHIKNVVIGATRNWSKNVLEWNLASSPDYDLHTDGGCTTCKGALMIDGNSITKEVSYYIIASVSKFVRPGAVRVGTSDNVTNLLSVAFQNRDGSKVLVVLNEGNSFQHFGIKFDDKTVTTVLPAGSVGTYVWE